MRGIALFSILLLIAALILNIVLLVAGGTPGVLEGLEIVNLNTSNVGTTLVTSSNSPLESVLNDIIKNNPTASAIAAANPSVSAAVKNVAASEAQNVAKAIGLQDYYAFHIMTFCKGSYMPNAAAANPTLNTSACVNSTEFYYDNLTQLIQAELKVGSLPLPDLPAEANDGWNALQAVFRATFVLYCVTIAATGFTIITGIIAMCLDGRMSACINGVFTILVALVSIVTSALATVIAYAIEGIANANTDKVGVSASKGTTFLTMTWIATALLLVAFILWSVDCCVGGDRRNRGRYIRANDQDMHEMTAYGVRRY